MIIVTGPSLQKAHLHMAPKTPVLMRLDSRSLQAFTVLSYNGMACSGRAAAVNEGRLPFLTEAMSVN